MHRKYADSIIENTMSLFIKGESVREICEKTGASASTIYRIIQKNKPRKSKKGEKSICYRDYYDLERKYFLVKNHLKILETTNCLPSQDRRAKLKAIEANYGKFPT